MSNLMEEQFIRIIEANKVKINRLCRIYALSPWEPKDLFQEVICEIWKSYPSFKGNSEVGTWIYRITLNVCYRAHQKESKKARNTIQLDSIKFEPVAEAFKPGEEQRYLALRHCINKLKEIDRSVVALHLDELPYKHIAEITGLTENHVAVKIKRVRALLLKCLLSRQSAL